MSTTSVRDTSSGGDCVESDGILASRGVDESGTLRYAESRTTRMQNPIDRVDHATSRFDGSIARKIRRDLGASRRG